MAQYDGSIRIGTEITTKQAEKELKSLESSISKTAGKIASLRSKMDSLKDAKIPTAEYTKLQSQLDSTIKKYEELDDQVRTFQKIGMDTKSEPFRRAQDEARELYMKVEDLRGQMFELEESGKAFTLGSDTEKYAQMSAQMQQLNQQMQSDTQRQSELQSALANEEERLAQIKANATVSDQELVDLLAQEKELLGEIADLKKAGVTEGYQEYDDAMLDLADVREQISAIREARAESEETQSSYKGLRESIRNAFSIMGKGLRDIPIAAAEKGAEKLKSALISVGNIGKKSLSRVGTELKGIAASFFRIGRGAKSASSNMSRLNGAIKKMIAYGIGVSGLYALINKLRGAAKEGFSNLYNDRGMTAFKSQVDSLKASVLTLKNAFAAAFRPIVEIAIPYIQKLIDYMIQLANVAGQFFAVITGQKSYTKAIRQTTEAINDQNKAQNRQLSGLDKLNNLTSQSGGGAGSNAENMFEEVPVDSKFKNIVQWLKDMWEDADFTDLGSTIGKKIKGALDNIPWNGIRESARKVASSIATLINGFVETEGLGYGIGNTLAQGINTAFEFLNSFVHKLHWKSVGSFIAEQLNGFFEGIDWNLIYDTFVIGASGLAESINEFIRTFHWDNVSDFIANSVNTFSDAVYEFFGTVNWDELGENLGDQLISAVDKINWKKVGNAIGSVVQSGLDFLISAARKIIDNWQEVAQAIIDTLKGFFETCDWHDLALVFGTILAAKLAVGVVSSMFTTAATSIGSAIASALSTYALPLILTAVAGWGLYEMINSIIEGETAISSIDMEALRNELLETSATSSAASSGVAQSLEAMRQAGVRTSDEYISITSKLEEGVQSFKEAVENTAHGIHDTFGSMAEDTNASSDKIVKSTNSAAEQVCIAWENAGESMNQTAQQAESDSEAISDAWWIASENIDNSMSQMAQQAETDSERVSGAWWEAGEAMNNSSRNFANNTQLYFQRTFETVLSETKIFIENLRKRLKDMPTVSAGSVFGGMAAVLPNTKIRNAASSARIPGYATGQVIPRSMSQHLAVLGDNNRETEVVSPLSTIKQALREEAMSLGISGGNGQEINLNLTVECEGYQLLHIMQKLDRQYFKQTGKHAFV